MTWGSCIINLNSDSTGSFYTGDIVTGTVILEFLKAQKIKSIDFEVVGISKAQWTRSMPTMPYIKTYSEKKKLLHIKISDIFRGICVGYEIPSGIYTYPFHFALPDDIPSTFQSSIANVNYYIKIKSKPSCKLRKMVPFNVLGNVNINHFEEILLPSFHEFRNTFHNAGRFNFSVKTYTGFSCRQIIPFEVTINNEKRVKISKLSVTLLQKLYCNIEVGYAEQERKICKIGYKSFANINTTEVCYFKMEIPQITPSSIHLTNPIIDISYCFLIEVMFPFHFTIRENIPVKIATVPVIHYDF